MTAACTLSDDEGSVFPTTWKTYEPISAAVRFANTGPPGVCIASIARLPFSPAEGDSGCHTGVVAAPGAGAPGPFDIQRSRVIQPTRAAMHNTMRHPRRAIHPIGQRPPSVAA